MGYTLPVSLSRKAGINRLRFYLGAENLFTITKYDGLDPEVGFPEEDVLDDDSEYKENLNFGVDRGTYPQARTFTVGFNLSL